MGLRVKPAMTWQVYGVKNDFDESLTTPASWEFLGFQCERGHPIIQNIVAPLSIPWYY